MGFYSSAQELAHAIGNFQKGVQQGLPQGGKKEARKFRQYYDQLPKLEREAFRMNYPVEYRFWVKAGTRRKPYHGQQLELFPDA